MIRQAFPWLLAAVALQPGCTPPGKPAAVPNDGLPSKTMDFGTLYSTQCAGCHGVDGTLGPAPPLNDPLFLRIVLDAELLRVIAEGRPGTAMPAFDQSKGGPLDSSQVKMLAEGLKLKWGQPGGPKNVPPYTMVPDGDANRGAVVFGKSCSGCHGDHGQGGSFGGKPVGAINDPSFLALSSNQVLRRYVITGRSDLGMPNFADSTGRSPDFIPLSSQDVADAVALLASWRKLPAGK
jgi:mono/diheme cytochrome c family protein